MGFVLPLIFFIGPVPFVQGFLSEYYSIYLAVSVLKFICSKDVCGGKAIVLFLLCGDFLVR